MMPFTFTSIYSSVVCRHSTCGANCGGVFECDSMDVEPRVLARNISSDNNDANGESSRHKVASERYLDEDCRRHEDFSATQCTHRFVRSDAFSATSAAESDAHLSMYDYPSHRITSFSPWEHNGLATYVLAPVKKISRDNRRERKEGHRRAIKMIIGLPRDTARRLHVSFNPSLTSKDIERVEELATDDMEAIDSECEMMRRELAVEYYRRLYSIQCTQLKRIATSVSKAQQKVIVEKHVNGDNCGGQKNKKDAPARKVVNTCQVCFDAKELEGVEETKLIASRDMKGGCTCRFHMCMRCISKQIRPTFDGNQMFQCPTCRHEIEYWTEQVRIDNNDRTIVDSEEEDHEGRSFVPVQVTQRQRNDTSATGPRRQLFRLAQPARIIDMTRDDDNGNSNNGGSDSTEAGSDTAETGEPRLSVSLLNPLLLRTIFESRFRNYSSSSSDAPASESTE